MSKVTYLPYYQHFTQALLDKENKIVMDWSAKAGCTLLTHMFFRKMGILDKALAFNPWVHNYRERFYDENGYVTMKILNNPDYYKFKFVRNPYTRVVSSFFNAVHHKDKIFQKFLGDKKIEDSTFREFVSFLKTVNLYKCNLHYCKQKKMFEDEEFKFDRVCKLENLEEEVKKINEDTGLNYVIKKIPNNHHLIRNSDFKLRVSDEPCLKIFANIPDYKYFYDRNLVEQVYDIYKDDIEEYDYTFDLGDIGQDIKYSN